MNDKVKDIIHRCKDDIRMLNLDNVYKECNKITSSSLTFEQTDLTATSDITTMLMRIGVDVLRHITAIPPFFLYNASFDSQQDMYIGKNIVKLDGYAFSNCRNITKITFDSSSSITEIPVHAFTGMPELEEIVLPPNIIYIRYYAFAACTNITTLKLPRTIEVIDHDAFAKCTRLKTITYDGTLEEFKKIKFGKFWRQGSITRVICSDGVWPK